MTIATAMQQTLNLAYFKLGRHRTLAECWWRMDPDSLADLASHMGVTSTPTRCAGLPVVPSVDTDWALVCGPIVPAQANRSRP